MNCDNCSERAVLLKPKFCKKHFINYFEDKVFEEIRNENISGEITVACSGGKDSVTVLYLLHKFGVKVKALAIDEGIKNYRDESLESLKKFCSELNVNLEVFSFKKEFGKTLDEIMKVKKHSCKYCGVLRRNLLNKYSANLLATGHNLDDESQAAFMNLITGRKELFPGGKKDIKNLVRRIKPLKYCSEKEVMTYSFLKNFPVDFNECPNLKNSQREKVRDLLNNLEVKNPGSKKNILRKFESINIKRENLINFCRNCNNPTRQEICNACNVIREVKAI